MENICFNEKVHLPGEWPWAQVIERRADGTILARIGNHPVYPHLHGFSYGDVALFEWRDDAWELATQQPAANDTGKNTTSN